MTREELIEKFFDQGLNPEEQELFDRQLKEDASFAQAVEMERDILAGMEYLGNRELKKELNVIHAEEIDKLEKRPVRKIAWRRWISAAAAILAILSIWWLWPGSEISPAALYAEYARHELDFTEKGESSEWTRIGQSIDKQQYQQALSLLSSLSDADTALVSNPEYLLAKGICLMELGRYEQAGLQFDHLQNVPLYNYEASWYHALLYLKQGQTEACKSQLIKIPEASSRYQIARELLAKL